MEKEEGARTETGEALRVGTEDGSGSLRRRKNGKSWGLGRVSWKVAAVAMVAVLAMVAMVGTGWMMSMEWPEEAIKTRSFFGSRQAAGSDEDRLIPFLPGLMKAAELASRNDIYSLQVERVRKVIWTPYRLVREVCRSERFNLSEPSPDRVMYEISVGNCGSTWQLVMLGKIIRMKQWRLPIELIPKSVISNWPGLENVSIGVEKTPGSWGEGEFFGKMFKVQRYHPDLFDGSSITFNAFKLSEYHQDMNKFAQGTCPCCYLMKELLGDRESEIAMIYMHALALGIDVSERDVYEVRMKLAEWIKGKYCWPGSIHTSACSVVDEFPELHSKLPFLEYTDLEEIEGSD